MEANYVTTNKRVSHSSSSKEGTPDQYMADQSSVFGMNGSNGNLSISYKSNIAPRSVIIQRNTVVSSNVNSSGSPLSSGGYVRQRISAVPYSLLNGQSSNSFAMISSTSVNAVKQSSDKEKKDMQDLNERFASYIEKVRFLEAQNRKLTEELDRLKAKWGKETSQIKAMYQAELDEARRLFDETTKEKARLEIRVASLEEHRDEALHSLLEANQDSMKYREIIETLNQQIAGQEADISLLRKRIDGLENDKEKDKKTIMKLDNDLKNARNSLDGETLLHVDAENRRQTLEEEIEFLKTIHEQEMKELAALAYRDSTLENREFWKAEMGQALREIQNIYDDKLTVIRQELEGIYNLKMQEFKTGATRQNMESSHSKDEVKRLRSQFNDLKDKLNDLETKNALLLRDLDAVRRDADSREKELYEENNSLKDDLNKVRAEMESLLMELQNIMDTKLGLELEIAAYRKLLEGEENRTSLRNIVEGYSTYGGDFGNTSFTSGGGGAGYGSGVSGGYYSSSVSGRPAAASAGGAVNSSSYSASSGSNTLTLTGVTNGLLSNGGVGISSLQSFSSNMQDLAATPAKSLKGELSSKTTFHKNSKGPVALLECPQDGKYIVVDNNGRKPENLGGWKIVRTVDNNKVVEYAFKEGFIIEPSSSYKVWARASKPEVMGGHDLEFEEDTWGVGANVTTRLFNINGEERAIYTQKTTYM